MQSVRASQGAGSRASQGRQRHANKKLEIYSHYHCAGSLLRTTGRCGARAGEGGGDSLSLTSPLTARSRHSPRTASVAGRGGQPMTLHQCSACAIAFRRGSLGVRGLCPSRVPHAPRTTHATHAHAATAPGGYSVGPAKALLACPGRAPHTDGCMARRAPLTCRLPGQTNHAYQAAGFAALPVKVSKYPLCETI